MPRSPGVIRVPLMEKKSQLPSASSLAAQETIAALKSQLQSFQDRMKRVEESLLSRDYKKHIEVLGYAWLVASEGHPGCKYP